MAVQMLSVGDGMELTARSGAGSMEIKVQPTSLRFYLRNYCALLTLALSLYKEGMIGQAQYQ
jgi:hypothetical protein